MSWDEARNSFQRDVKSRSPSTLWWLTGIECLWLASLQRGENTREMRRRARSLVVWCLSHLSLSLSGLPLDWDDRASGFYKYLLPTTTTTTIEYTTQINNIRSHKLKCSWKWMKNRFWCSSASIDRSHQAQSVSSLCLLVLHNFQLPTAGADWSSEWAVCK